MTTLSSTNKSAAELHYTTKKSDETEEQALLRDLVMEALDHPERCETIVGIIFQKMNGLIDDCRRTPDRTAAKLLTRTARCLANIHQAMTEGSNDQKALIQKHEEKIQEMVQRALECATSIPKPAHGRASSALTSPGGQEPTAAQVTTTISAEEQLLADGLDRRDDTAVLSAVAQGAPITSLSQSEKDRLAALALSRLQDRALAALIRAGCCIFNPAGQSPMLLDVVSGNLTLSAKALIDRHANLHTTDVHGNTALHRAFLLGNPEMVTLLISRIDPQSLNAFHQTPLSSLLWVRPENTPYLQIPDANVPSFVETLFKRNLEELPGKGIFDTPARAIALKSSGGKIPPTSFDIVEMAFLLHIPELDAALFAEMDTTTFTTACANLEGRYPRESVVRFLTSPFAVNPFHYQMGGESAPVPPLGAKNPPLSSLLTLFDRLNFHNPAAPHYVDAVAWWKSISPGHQVLPKDEAIKQIRQGIKAGVDTIANRIHFAAVPPVEPEKWFARIELLLKHIIIKLEEKNNPPTTLSTIKELRAGFQFCATAYTNTVVNCYERLCFNVDPSQKDVAFLRSLANYRRQCFDEALNLVHDREIHHAHKALVVLGPELGLPGHEEEARYIDAGFQGDGNPDAVRKVFLARYTPSSIVDWLLQALKANTDSIRNPFIDLQKHFMLSNWQQEKYGPVHEQLKKLRLERDASKRTAAVEELLRANDIVMSVRSTPAQKPRLPDLLEAQRHLMQAHQAVEEDRSSEYLANVVFHEDGSPRLQAVIHLLSCMGVIQSRLR